MLAIKDFHIWERSTCTKH